MPCILLGEPRLTACAATCHLLGQLYCRRDLEHARHHSRQMSARMASAHLMTQNAEAASAQQLAAAAAAEHKAEKLDLKLADVQWELEQCQRQLKDKTAQAEQQLKV